jgi:hypothetical protein
LDTSLAQLAESDFGIDVALLHDDLLKARSVRAFFRTPGPRSTDYF